MTDKSVITELGNHIRQLIDDHKRLSGLAAELAAENGTLKAVNRSLQEKRKELETELSRMQLTVGFAGDDRDRDKARARVNRLMREVGKCIDLLSTAEPAGDDAEPARR